MKTISDVLRNNKQFLLYLFFGVCTTAINTACYWLLYNVLKLSNIISTILAWLIAVVFAFVINKIYVFESKQLNSTECIKEAVSFFGCRVITGVLDVLIMAIAIDLLQWNALLWKLISNILVTIINYIASKYLIFKDANERY